MFLKSLSYKVKTFKGFLHTYLFIMFQFTGSMTNYQILEVKLNLNTVLFSTLSSKLLVNLTETDICTVLSEYLVTLEIFYSQTVFSFNHSF